MTSGNGVVQVRKAEQEDLKAIKAIADAHRHELGFVMRPALERSIERSELFVAVEDNNVVGFLEYHHRRDRQTTLYHIAVVEEMRRRGVARELLDALRQEAIAEGKETIRLKCPVALPANEFYTRVGWQRIAREEGKARPLLIWELPLK